MFYKVQSSLKRSQMKFTAVEEKMLDVADKIQMDEIGEYLECTYSVFTF